MHLQNVIIFLLSNPPLCEWTKKGILSKIRDELCKVGRISQRSNMRLTVPLSRNIAYRRVVWFVDAQTEDVSVTAKGRCEHKISRLNLGISSRRTINMVREGTCIFLYKLLLIKFTRLA